MPDSFSAMPSSRAAVSSLSETDPRALSNTAWTMLLPWLDGYRGGPSILASDELIPNAWLAGSPAENLRQANFSRFCELVALRYVQDRPDKVLGDDFPTVAAHLPVITLGLGSHSLKALRDNRISTIDELLTHSVSRLLGLPHVGRATVVDLIAALVGLATHTGQGADLRSGDRVLSDPTLRDFIDSLDERDRIILHERIFAGRPRTQASLAKQFNLSRERVNQLDRALRVQLSETLDSSVDLRRLLAETLALADPVADAGRVAEALPLFSTVIPALGVSVGQVLVAGSSVLSSVDGWIVSRSPTQIADMVGETLDAHTNNENLAPVHAVASALALPEPEAARWLVHSGYKIFGDHVVNGPTTTGDLVCAVLSIAGAPQTFDDILTALADEPRSRSSVRNALVTDDRIVKTDRTTYGLRRWGGDTYVPVHRQIGRLLDAAGGHISITELITHISDNYDVTETSIRAYAGAGEFVTRNETVTRREEQYVHRKSPTKTRGLYRDGDTIRWATTVAAAHLKGSAFNIPSALAGLLGVGPGTPIHLPSRLGPQSLMWVSVQARVGTIKRFVTDLELTHGDPIFLEFTPDGFDIRRQTPTPTTQPVPRILALLGRDQDAPHDSQTLTKILVNALFLPDESDINTIVATLRHRKELELAELVTTALT